MALIKTEKGWAIEFEPITSANRKPSATDIAGKYTAVLKSLMDTIQTAQSNDQITDSPDYYTLLILENMLPSFDDAAAMFENMKTVK